MDKQTKTKIKNLVLALRDDFEKEIENRLDNIGIYPDKEWKDGRSLSHLLKDELENRKRVAIFIRREDTAFAKREEKTDFDQKKATSEFIKETSYTWINRLLGLKCMECRGLIEEVITTRPEYGGRSKQHRDFREKNPDKAAQPDDGLIACLFSAFEEVTEEIKVLFDPKNEYSLVIPRYPTLRKAIEKINTELDYDTYREDEFLGWVYQYFNSREKDRVFEEVRTKKKKISGNDIINVTQLYTEKYMVRFLVENSLGAMWMEMYPGSQLYNKWEYFVKDLNNSRREPKPVKEIRFLDPAGGSGHFLLYAFDLFYDMYLEEGIIPKNQIPEFILRYNLHGIDIDLRAIQLSALALYMKAKSKNPGMKIQHMNLVSADAIMLNSEMLKEFLKEFEDDQMAHELIGTIWKGLENVRELGSLLKVEEQIDEIIERHRQKLGAQKSLDARDWKEKGWEQWKHELLVALKRYYEKAAQAFDINKQMFASEGCKGVQLLDFFEQEYDVVATNPPYMGHGNMGQNLREYTQSHYSLSNYDLYSMFIQRCIEFAKYMGIISMITQNSFMFISSFDKIRKYILDQTTIAKFVHLGPGAFNEISGEVVNTSMFALYKDNYKLKNNSVFIKLVDKSDKEKTLRDEIYHENFYYLNQTNFSKISGRPFAYWLSNKIFDIFDSIDDLSNYFDSKAGLSTGNNDKFVRFFWEINIIEKSLKWYPYVKGGGSNKYYINNDSVVDWENNGFKIRNYKDENGKLLSRPQNIKFYFKEGITYNKISTAGFACRYKDPNFIFADAGSSIFPKENGNVYYTIGFLNTKVSQYILNVFNPTLNFQAGDIARIPFHWSSVKNLKMLY